MVDPQKPRALNDLIAAEPRALRRGAVDKQMVKESLLASGRQLQDADSIGISNRTRLGSAYLAVHDCARAIVSAQGLKSGAEPGHHKVILEALCSTLGYSAKRFASVMILLDSRNGSAYRSQDPEASALDEARTVAKQVRDDTLQYLQANHATLLKP